MTKSNQKPHAIIIPCPFQGHINPSIYLSLKLATKGFTITFINTESIHAQITKSQTLDQNSTTTTKTHDIFGKFQEFGLDIHYQTVSDGFPLEFDRFSGSNNGEFWERLLINCPIHVDEIVGKLVELENPKPTCLIVDTFFAWGTTIANKYQLVSISFFTQPALVFTIDYHLHLLLKNGHFGSNGKYPPSPPSCSPIIFILRGFFKNDVAYVSNFPKMYALFLEDSILITGPTTFLESPNSIVDNVM